MITDEVIKAIKRDVWRYTKFGIDREDAEGISMVGLCKATKTYDETKGIPFLAYARNVIKYHHLDELRSRTKRGKIPIYEYKRPIQDDDLTFELDEDKILTLMRIWKLIELLSPADQRILRFKYLEDLEVGEIASKLSVKTNSVHIMISRATRRLKEIIAEEHQNGFQRGVLGKEHLKDCLAKWA